MGHSTLVRVRRRPLVATVLGVCVACSDAPLERVPIPPATRPDLLVRVLGRVCTRDPEEVRFPVRIAFVVDTSQSMTVSDPPIFNTDLGQFDTGRQRAIREVVDALGFSPEVSYAIIAFNGTTAILTQFDSNGDGTNDRDGYSSDETEVRDAIASLALDASTTNYIAALSAAFELATADVLDLADITPDEVPRAKYVFVFLSDGLPDSDDEEPVEDEDIFNAVEDIVELEDRYDVGEVAFHTSYLSANATPAAEQAASDLLRGMSEVGEGTFRSFPNGESINFLTIDFTSIRRVFSLVDLLVANSNARPLQGAIDRNGDGLPDSERAWLPEADSDADGLPDSVERGYANLTVRDSDDDGFSDFLEWRLAQNGGAFDPYDPMDAQCPSEVDRADRDFDGLRDCEELFFGSNPRFFDSDLDGLPDPVEIAFGTDAAVADADRDTDTDGGDNGLEVRSHTDPLIYDAADRAQRSYLYQVEQLPTDGSRSCADFDVSSISLAATADGWNQILVYAGERPFDRPNAFVLWRLACARARYLAKEQAKIPADGRLVLSEEDFVTPEEFDPAVHCVDPE